MTTMRAKLTVQSVTRYTGFEQLVMVPQYSNSREDNSYAAATPNGKLELTISNTDLHGKFNPGDTFYVDFTPA